MKEYKLQVPDDTVGISITISFNVESALETYILDLMDGEGGQHDGMD